MLSFCNVYLSKVERNHFFWSRIHKLVILSGPPGTLQTEFSCFCKVKYLLIKETHNKNEENTLKELNDMFLTVYGLSKKFFIGTL